MPNPDGTPTIQDRWRWWSSRYYPPGHLKREQVIEKLRQQMMAGEFDTELTDADFQAELDRARGHADDSPLRSSGSAQEAGG